MNGPARSLGALLWVTGVPAVAHAAAEGSGAFVWEVVNMILLIGVLVFLTRKPLLNYLAERRDTIRSNIETSEKLLADAEGRLAEWNRRAAGLDAEAAEIRAAALKSAEDEAAAIVAEAQASAERIRASARSTVDSELRRARSRLRKEAVDLSVELARRIIREQIQEGDRDRLFDEFVEKIGQGGAR